MSGTSTTTRQTRVAPRRALAWLALAALLGSATWAIARPDGPWAWSASLAVAALGAGTLAQYVPMVGRRLDLGCTPCAVASGLSVPLALVLLGSGVGPGLAVVVAAAGLVQRLRQPNVCPT